MGDTIAPGSGRSQGGNVTPNLIARSNQKSPFHTTGDSQGMASHYQDRSHDAKTHGSAPFYSQFDYASPQFAQYSMQHAPDYSVNATMSPTQRMDMAALGQALPDLSGPPSVSSSYMQQSAPFVGQSVPPYPLYGHHNLQPQMQQYNSVQAPHYRQNQNGMGQGLGNMQSRDGHMVRHQQQYQQFASFQTPYGPQFVYHDEHKSRGYSSPHLSRPDLQAMYPNYPALDQMSFMQGHGAATFSPDPVQQQGGIAFPRKMSETGPTPSFPRGPPRKPKQSGHALWVGNLPPGTNVMDLKDHFSRDAKKDIQSLFLISKSNCAFVNYRTESACAAAMTRFHDSRFHGLRLVCRLRRRSIPNAQTTSQSGTDGVDSERGRAVDSPDPARLASISTEHSSTAHGSEADGAETLVSEAGRVPQKFFIVKSLTMQDLEASVRNGVWATQSHNESILNKAFENADNVYLVFSANKSGEYFGYARMRSAIEGSNVTANPKAVPESTNTSDGPKSIPTPATESAPKGRIIDDSARGTIFWEAEGSDVEDDETSSPPPTREASSDPHTAQNQDWGKPFEIEWLSTNRLPFYRTRGLRNPWNANREVKIARDGTELEPSVGKRLVQMFHRPAGPPVQQY